MERKEFRLDSVASDSGSFEGYASTYEVDSVNDIVMPGAYTKTLPKFLSAGVVHWAHDFSVPVGWPTAAYEDSRGLYIRAQYHSTPAGQNARTVTAERLAAGMNMGLSIGYTVVDFRYREDGVRELHEINLLEVSLVTLTAAAAATVTEIKCIECIGQCPDSPALSPDERKELEAIHHRVLDRELSRLGDMLTYRRGLAADYAERGQNWSEVPAAEVSPSIRQKSEIALLDAAVDLWISPPPLRFFSEAVTGDEIAFTAPPLWGSFRDGAVWISDSPGHDPVKTTAHEMWHAAHSGADELVAGSEERAAQEYGEAASTRWHQ